MLWIALGVAVFAVLAIVDWRARHRLARRYARHPWLTGVALGLGYALGPLIGYWRDDPEVAGAMAIIGGVIFAVIHAVGWGPEGFQRLRYIRRYGAPPEWSEHRWLPEGSNWPY